MANYLYIDLESLPTSDPDVVADIALGVSPPGSMTKAETLEKWEKETKPGLVTEAVAKTSFNGAFGSVCCIGWAWGDAETKSRLRGDDERSFLIETFAAITAEQPHYGMATVVGHNVSSFDVRFLWQRCFILGIRAPSWLPLDPKPWGNSIADTMTIFSGVRDRISLDKLCRAMGLPGKDGMSGEDVAGAWERGEFEEIAAYCRSDVESVRAVHKRILIATGQDNPSAAGTAAHLTAEY